MAVYTPDDKLCLKDIEQQLEAAVEASGFKAFREFSAVDSLIYNEQDIGFYALKKFKAVASSRHHESMKRYIEADCDYEIRLMGRSCKFSDYMEFYDRCQTLYSQIVTDSSLLVVSMELGDTYQSMPLKRLARDVKLTLRVCLKEENV